MMFVEQGSVESYQGLPLLVVALVGWIIVRVLGVVNLDAFAPPSPNRGHAYTGEPLQRLEN